MEVNKNRAENPWTKLKTVNKCCFFTNIYKSHECPWIPKIRENCKENVTYKREHKLIPYEAKKHCKCM